MHTYKRFILKCLLFSTILGGVLFVLTWIFLPKAYFNNDWTDTSTVSNFYDIERDSVEVLFLGSSHCATSFMPQDLYDHTGLTSYNLGTGQQSVLVSYYLLKEALHYQHPKVVVLDTYMCFRNSETLGPLNCDESSVRYAIDPMRWSLVKVEAIRAICANDGDHTMSSFYNPLERFHTRWDALDEEDFAVPEYLSYKALKGYSLLSGISGIETYQPFAAGTYTEFEDMYPLMEEYLDKITTLCKDNKIDLILVAAPYDDANEARYNRIASYAEDHDLAYYDFNENSLYRDSGFEYRTDTRDPGHPNYWGARKLTFKLGDIILGEYPTVRPKRDEQWENSRLFCEGAVHNAELQYVSDIETYLSAINREGYTIFLAIKDDSSAALTESIIAGLSNLGLNTDLRDKFRSSYIAVISDGKVKEEYGDKALSSSGSFRNGRSTYRVSSAGYDTGNQCSIVIDGVEYAKNARGLNIVIYDSNYREVIDSVAFDTYETLAATR